jgi:hypothetical protein
MSEYDTDILLWSERQAELLRRRAAGDLVNDAEINWPNVAEEIESVGNEPLHAVESFLVQALLHDLEAEAWPRCPTRSTGCRRCRFRARYRRWTRCWPSHEAAGLRLADEARRTA